MSVALGNIDSWQRDRKDLQYEKELREAGNDVRDLYVGTAVIWRAGSTFRHCCDIMVLYVSGLLMSAPSHAGPILGESDIVRQQLAQCNRNGLLTISSEPSQKDINTFSGEEFFIENASLEFWIKKHNEKHLIREIEKYGDRFDLKNIQDEVEFHQVMGANFRGEDKYTTRYFITDTEIETNEMFEIMVRISSGFTEYPLNLKLKKVSRETSRKDNDQVVSRSSRSSEMSEMSESDEDY